MAWDGAAIPIPDDGHPDMCNAVLDLMATAATRSSFGIPTKCGFTRRTTVHAPGSSIARGATRFTTTRIIKPRLAARLERMMRWSFARARGTREAAAEKVIHRFFRENSQLTAQKLENLPIQLKLHCVE